MKLHKMIVDLLTNGVFSINREVSMDGLHSVKRKRGFDLFDKMLSGCKKGICPAIEDIEDFIYCLSDISINCYIKERAYYYSVDGIGIDDNNRHYMAIEKIDSVLNCNNFVVKLDEEVFKRDICETQNDFMESSRNRKAYWEFLTLPYSNPYNNYCNACFFLERQYSLNESFNSREYKKLLICNKDKANAIDLFRLCYIRKMEIINSIK